MVHWGNCIHTVSQGNGVALPLFLIFGFFFNNDLCIFVDSLTGLSPFGGSTEQEVLQSTIQYRWQEVDGLSPEAKDFLSKILIRNQK